MKPSSVNSAIATAALAAVKRGFLKRLTSIIGCADRDSATAMMASTATPPAMTVAVEAEPRWWSWRLPLLVVAGVAPLILMRMRGLPESGQAAGSPAIRQLLRRNPVLLVLFAFGLFEGAALLCFFTFFAPALQARGASASVAGAVMGGYGVATAAGSWLLGRLPDRLVPRLPLFAGGRPWWLAT